MDSINNSVITIPKLAFTYQMTPNIMIAIPYITHKWAVDLIGCLNIFISSLNKGAYRLSIDKEKHGKQSANQCLLYHTKGE